MTTTVQIVFKLMSTGIFKLKYGRQEMFESSQRYCDAGRERERNVLFNDTLNTFYLRLYGVRHMVKGYSDSARENPLQSHGLHFQINSKGSFICTIPQTG